MTIEQIILLSNGAFQPQNVTDQQKQLFQQQRPMPEAPSTSSDSTAQTGNPNGGDWQEEVYQKIKAMKDRYMLELNDLYQKIVGKLQQYDCVPEQPKNEQVVRLKTLKHAVERSMEILQIPKTNISPNVKEKLGVYERYIVNIINSYIRKPSGLPLQQPLPPPHIQGGTMQQNNMGRSHNNPGSPLSGFSNQQVKQVQHRQMQPQLLNKQQQFQRQTKQQLQMTQVALTDGKQQQQLKFGPPFSPQLSQDQLNCLTKSGNSPFTISSPSTPSTCHMLGESEKVNSGVSSLCNAGNQ